MFIDEQLLAEAMKLTGLPTRKATVEAGLRLLIRRYGQQNIRKLRGKLSWQGDLEQMRKSRF